MIPADDARGLAGIGEWFWRHQRCQADQWMSAYVSGNVSLAEIRDAAGLTSLLAAQAILAAEGVPIVGDGTPPLRRRSSARAPYAQDLLALAGAHLGSALVGPTLVAAMTTSGRRQEHVAEIAAVPLRTLESYVGQPGASPPVGKLVRLFQAMDLCLLVVPGPVPLPVFRPVYGEDMRSGNALLDGLAGERFRSLRESAGLKQSTVATRAGLSRPTLSRIERGLVDPSYATVERMALALRHRVVVVDPAAFP